MRQVTISKDQFLRWTQRTIGISLIISYLLALFGIIRMQIIPFKYLLFLIPITAAVVAWMAFTHLKKSLPRGKRIAFSLLSLFAIIVNIGIFSASSATMSFLSGLNGNDLYIEYNIIAKKDRHISLSTNNQRTGVITTDVNINEVKSEVTKRTKTVFNEQANVDSLKASLTTNTVDMMVLPTSQLELQQESDAIFYQSIEKLATFKIKVKNTSSTVKTDTTKPFIVYISGIDTYGDISTVSRSDVNILAVVDPRTNRILLVNTPRDYYVQLHGTTGVKDKLTHAGIYGIDMSMQTLEDLYGVDISYYMRVNFGSLTSIVDTLGGVNVYSDNSFRAGGYSFEEGFQEMDGKQALAFSRERYALEGGDRTRGKNQQRVIEAIIRKMSSPALITNYQAILKSLTGTFHTNADTRELTNVMNRQLDTMQSWKIESIDVDGTGTTAPTYSMGAVGLYVMEPNQASLDAAKQKIKLYQ